MIFTGMIFQYDNSQGMGLLMLSDGEQKEFTNDNWINKDNQPAVGQKISYENTNNIIKVNQVTDEDIKQILADNEAENSVVSVDEHISNYISVGFKLVKDDINDNMRTSILRSFATGESQEIIIKENNSVITISQTVNGKEFKLE